MSTRSFIHLTRLIQAIFIIVLCGLLAAGVCAADRNNGSGRDSTRQNNSARDGKGQRSNSSYNNRANQPADSGRYNQSHWNRDNSVSKPSGGDHKTTPSPAGNVYRPGQKPNTNNTHPSNWQNKRDDRNQYKPRVNIPDRNNNKPRSYQPPSYHESTHYYPSHPTPYHYGHWVFDNRNPSASRRSVYFYYGYFPYMQVTRVHTRPYIIIGYRNTRIVLGEGYYLSRDNSDLDQALSDIRDAWIDGRYDLIDRHVDSNDEIAVMLDGRYDYSVDANDYADMTSDALDEVRTVSFTWESIRQRTNGDYTAFGKHVFRDSRGDLQTVYVSYTLQRIGSDYTIVEVGSSNSPLR
ncbi:MAG: hypothetical protein ABFD54_16230 [Armatimonadota bacterium]|nr:hypothetical protein [bacterium]